MSLISGNVIFGADAINCSSSSILGAAAFMDTASNQGTVSVASFSDTAVNEGTAVSAVFSDGAVNVGSLTSGTFLGTAVNSGVVTVAEFFGTASNVGVIVEAAKFADTSSNVGVVSGSAIFADTSISDGVVEGTVQLGASVAQGENQALTETPTEYTQPDGYFPNQYYNGGVQAVPADYDRKVYQVNGFWYKYNNNGNGQLANGNYHDGTNWFGFTDGTKTLNINASITSYSIVLGGTTYYYASTLQNGERLYEDSLLIIEAVNLSSLNAGDINSDGYNDSISTNGSGNITITYGEAEFPAQGTFIRNETVYTGMFQFAGANYGSLFANGTQDIVADGAGGEENGTYYPPAAGTTVTGGNIDITILGNVNTYNGGTVSWVTDGAGSFTQEFSLDNGDIIADNVQDQGYTTIYADGAGGCYTN